MRGGERYEHFFLEIVGRDSFQAAPLRIPNGEGFSHPSVLHLAGELSLGLSIYTYIYIYIRRVVWAMSLSCRLAIFPPFCSDRALEGVGEGFFFLIITRERRSGTWLGNFGVYIYIRGLD